jgi:hypothetical protein
MASPRAAAWERMFGYAPKHLSNPFIRSGEKIQKGHSRSATIRMDLLKATFYFFAYLSWVCSSSLDCIRARFL